MVTDNYLWLPKEEARNPTKKKSENILHAEEKEHIDMEI